MPKIFFFFFFSTTDWILTRIIYKYKVSRVFIGSNTSLHPIPPPTLLTLCKFDAVTHYDTCGVQPQQSPAAPFS